MAAAAISPLVTILSTLIQKEVGLLWGVDKELKKLSSTLSTILAVLDDAELKQHREKAIQNWLRKLKDAALEIGDILDECQTHARRQEIKGQNSGCLKKVWTSAITPFPCVNFSFRHKIGNRMKDIIEDINAIAQERVKFHLNVGSLENGFRHADDSRETGSRLMEPEVFGRGDDKERIVKMLTQDICDTKDLSVYPIIGMGGIGKTTLAQMIFSDERINSHFGLRIWVYVSQDFSVKRVMKQIIESTSGRLPEDSTLDSVQKALIEILSRNRYVLVLDDAWSEDQEEWHKLRHVLACGLPGSCIVVTSRSERVASITRTLPIHHLSYLSEGDCWLLFRQRAFGPDNEERPDLVSIGKRIVKKCGGVPLAAKALGGLLRFKGQDNEWLDVEESEVWDIPQEECSILPALKLSYYTLKLELRHCFSYCAIFPKGSPIEKDKIIQLWMANGFISSDGKLQVEDVGNRNCDELCKRSFFQNEEKDKTGMIYFKMHDLMHDLAQSVMDDKCLVMEAESSGGSVPKQRIRHATLVDDRKHEGVFPEALNRHTLLHTIMLQHREPQKIDLESEIDFFCDFKNFGSLRVFDANGARMMHLSESIGSSKHLRYLNLSETLIRTLPKSICTLYNLQTLNLNYCHNLQRLPKKMKRLIDLRHLCLLGCEEIKDMPPKLGKLTQLKTLSLFVVGKHNGQRLGELQNLDLGGKLSITRLERVRTSVEAEAANLAGKDKLSVVNLSWGKFTYPPDFEECVVEHQQQVIEALEPHPNVEHLSIRNYRGKELPAWMGNPFVLTNVVSITLGSCGNSCTSLPAIGQLPYLKIFSISRMKKVEYLIQNGNSNTSGGGGHHVTTVGAFPSLEQLDIADLPNLKGLSVEEEEEGREQQQIFPCLLKMDIWKCPKLILSTLPALEHLDICCGRNRPFSMKEESSAALLSSISKLSSLTSLSLSRNGEMVSFPDDMLQNLTRLQSLEIVEFTKLKVLPENMSSLVALEELRVINCEELECLPDGGVGSLLSLLHMEIIGCPNIVSLPDGIQNLTQLQSLRILGCNPELKRRCKKRKGQDWYKIAHVPHILIGSW